MAGSGNPWVDMIDPTFAQQEELANQIQQEQQAADAFAKAKENPYGLKADRRQISNPDNLAWLQNLAAQQQPQPTPEMPEQTPTQGAGDPLAGMQSKYVKALLESQGLQKEGIKSLQDRLKGLDAMKEDRGGLGKALATAADVWGGGGGTFSKLYDEVNPNMSPAQKQASKQALEDTLRKARGDLSDSEIAQLKAQLGFVENSMKLSAKKAGEKPTADQIKLGLYANQMEAADRDLNNLKFDKGWKPTDATAGFWSPAEGLKSDDRKRFEKSRNEFVSALNRYESGAAISPTEKQDAFNIYFPQPGDPPDVILSKAAARARKIADFKASSGKASAKMSPSVSVYGQNVTSAQGGVPSRFRK